ncbi:MAG: c-type cytochrome [Pseudomonadota bacterium]
MKIIHCSLVAAASLASPVAYAGGDANNGKVLYSSHCIACHSIDVSLAGPAHRGVYGRKAGSVADFEYSPAMKRSTLVWTEANLDKWLSNPEKLIPGQKMGYSVPDAKDRADLIAYLKTQTGRH